MRSERRGKGVRHKDEGIVKGSTMTFEVSASYVEESVFSSHLAACEMTFLLFILSISLSGAPSSSTYKICSFTMRQSDFA